MSDPTPKGRILIVDDEKLNRLLLSTNLKGSGYAVEEAVNGEDALEKVREQLFDIVLLDLIMPGIDGYEVLETMKSDSDLRHIPVIIVSAMDEMDSLVQCIELGATDYLFKPFDPVLLHARLNSSLSVKRLRDQEIAYTQQLEQQLELAGQAQRSMLPTMLPEPPGVSFAAIFEPARAVGGDFYDVFSLEGGKVGVLMADVSDKGMHAALFMGVSRALFARETAQSLDPVEVVTAVHLSLVGISSYSMFVTALYGILDPESRTFTFVRAGHDEPLLVRASGETKFMGGTGHALGMALGPPRFAAQTLTLDPGDSFIIYTDGVTDQKNPDREMFGRAQLEKRAISLRDQDADGLAQGIYHAVSAHRDGTDAFDDFTLLVMQAAK